MEGSTVVTELCTWWAFAEFRPGLHVSPGLCTPDAAQVLILPRLRQWWSISWSTVCSRVSGTKCLLPSGSVTQIPIANMPWQKTQCTGRWPLTRSSCPGGSWSDQEDALLERATLSWRCCSLGVLAGGFHCGSTEPDCEHLHLEHQPRRANGGAETKCLLCELW